MPDTMLNREKRIKKELDGLLNSLNEDQLCTLMESVGYSYSRTTCNIKKKEDKIELIKKRMEKVRFGV